MAPSRSLKALSGLLALVSHDVPPSALRRRTPSELARAEKWAALEHLSASDNPVRRIKRPEWLAEWECFCLHGVLGPPDRFEDRCALHGGGRS